MVHKLVKLIAIVSGNRTCMSNERGTNKGKFNHEELKHGLE